MGAGEDDRAVHGVGDAGVAAVDEGRSAGGVDHGGILHAAGGDAKVADDRAEKKSPLNPSNRIERYRVTPDGLIPAQ